MNKKLTQILILTTMLTGFGSADTLQVSYVSSINQGLHSPVSLAVGENYLAVLEPGKEALQLFTPDGILTRSIHLDTDAHSLIGLTETVLLFCQRREKRIYAYDILDNRKFVFAGDDTQLSDPVDLDFDGNNVRVLDAGNSRVLEFNSQGTLLSENILRDENSAALIFPSALAADIGRDKYYVLDQTKSRILVFDQNFQYSGHISSFGSADGRISRGGDLAVTRDGVILVSDRYQGRASAFSPDGDFLGFISEGDPVDQYNLPLATGIAVDDIGNAYFISTMLSSIQVYHINYRTYATAQLTAHPYQPEDNAIISEPVMMIAGIESESGLEKIAGIEFQLFAEADLVTPMENSGIIPLTADSDNQENRLSTAKWQPTADLENSRSYCWRSRVKAVDTAGIWSAMRTFTLKLLPDVYRLDQNYPNPFNSGTTISFTLPNKEDITLEVIDLLGRRVRTLWQGYMDAGKQHVVWNGLDDDGQNAASGIYFYRLKAGSFIKARRMVLIK